MLQDVYHSCSSIQDARVSAVVGGQMQWLLGNAHYGCCSHTTSILPTQNQCFNTAEAFQLLAACCNFAGRSYSIVSILNLGASTEVGMLGVLHCMFGSPPYIESCKGKMHKMLREVMQSQDLQWQRLACYKQNGYLSPLGLMMEEGADVSKAEHNTPGNGLTGVPTAEEPIWIAHDPAHAHTIFSTVSQLGA